MAEFKPTLVPIVIVQKMERTLLEEETRRRQLEKELDEAKARIRSLERELEQFYKDKTTP